MVIALAGVILFPFLANYLFLGGERSTLHYIISCTAFAYLLITYINIFLTYLGRNHLEHCLEPFTERLYTKNTTLPAYLIIWLLVTGSIVFAGHQVRGNQLLFVV